MYQSVSPAADSSYGGLSRTMPRRLLPPFFTGISSIFNLDVFSPCRLYLGNTNRLKPSFLRFADALLNPVYGADLSGQVYFSRQQISGSMAVSMLLDRMALITARSMAGSFTFSPPAMLKDVLLGKLEADPFFQYCQQHVHSLYVEAGGGTFAGYRKRHCSPVIYLCFSGTVVYLHIWPKRDGYAHSFMVLAEEQFEGLLTYRSPSCLIS